MSRVNQRLNGLNPLSYLGVDAYQPTDFIKLPRDPLTTDFNNFYLGTWWLNTDTNSLFYLAALTNGSATWINVSAMSGAVETLTANTGGPVPPTLGNINVVGDGVSMNIAGNPGTSTLTISAVGAPATSTLTGNSGGAVGPTMGNINIIGTAPISVAGNPGTSTLTVSQSGIVAQSFPTQSGTAIPVAGALTINGSNGLSTTGVGSTVTVVAGGTLSQSYKTSPATGTAIPAAGVLTFAGAGGITMSAAGSTVTITSSGGATPTYSTGSFVPILRTSAGTAGITYTRQNGQYVQIGNFVFVQIDIAIATWAPTIVGTTILSGLPFTVPSYPAAYGSPQVTFSTPITSYQYNIPVGNILYWYVIFGAGLVMGNPYTGSFLGAGAKSAPFFISNNLQNGSTFTVSGCYLI